MFSRVMSAAITGLEVHPVSVEADVSDGLPGFVMVGYLTSQVKEAQDRVRTALKNVGMALPPKKITVNLAPADIRKEGACFDLPIAAAILAAEGQVELKQLDQVFLAGEMGLNGEIHPVSGILPMVLKARECGCRLCIVPRDNLMEARVVENIQVAGVTDLREFMALVHCKIPSEGACAGRSPECVKKNMMREKEPIRDTVVEDYTVDFSDIRGQESLKRAALIAVSGFHNMLLIGPPGSGKTMLARRIPTILPPLTKEESLEISKIYSVAGLLSQEKPLMGTRPFRSPHHTSCAQALAGGGYIPKPGEITLAHRGVLFLDELPEFSRHSLEILRQPLEDRKIYLSRSSGTYCFPAEFLLLAAMNPCPCGHFPDMNRCTCTAKDVNRYRSKISFPLLDRMDVCVEAPAISYEELSSTEKGDVTSEQMRRQVVAAQQIQKKRYKDMGIVFNSELNPGQLEQFCPMTDAAKKLLERAFHKMGLSARGYHRIIRVARTIADLEAADVIDTIHISEAIQYRVIDKKYWRN